MVRPAVTGEIESDQADRGIEPLRETCPGRGIIKPTMDRNRGFSVLRPPLQRGNFTTQRRQFYLARTHGLNGARLLGQCQWRIVVCFSILIIVATLQGVISHET